MLKNYIKTAFRNLRRDRTYSLINIIGLSVGLAACFVIVLYSVHELSYDGYNKKLDRIYLATMDFGFKGEGWTQPLVPFPTGPALKARYPEIEDFARCSSRVCRIKYGSKSFNGIRCVSADSSVFNILTLPIVSGNLRETYSQRDYAVVSLGLAKKLFGDSTAVGRVIDVTWAGKQYYFTVTAVMADIPSTSTFRAQCILPLFPDEEWIRKTYADDPNILNSWMPGVIDTYILLSKKNSAEQLSGKLVAFSKRRTTIPNWPLVLHIVPLEDMYFRPSTMVNSFFPEGNLANVEIYSVIAFLTLLIACFNFVTLSTGRASIRTKEVGVRKVIGASRLDIAKQTMIETLIVSVISLPVALLLVELLMPSLTTLLGKRLPVNYDRSLESIAIYIGITLVAAILSGSYVSFYLSNFQPAEIFRNKFSRGHERLTLRRVLIGIQMVIFVGLILASITICRQMRYVHTRDMGFNDKNLVIFTEWKTGNADTTLGGRFKAAAADLKTLPQVKSVACGTMMPGSPGMSLEQAPSLSDPQKRIMFEDYSVSRGYFETLGMKMAYGKAFGQVPAGEAKDAVVMNQKAVEAFGITSPSQQLFKKHRILGVVKDFNIHSLHRKIAPTVFFEGSPYMDQIAVRFRQLRDAPKVIPAIEKIIKGFSDGGNVRYQFFDDRITAMYGSDYRFADMIGYFSGLAVFIACLGLFGMSLFAMQRRVKEIGVRKVLGASVTTILASAAKEFVVLLLISTVVSLPISIFFINEWLNEYAYHINVNVVSVLLTFAAGLVIVFLTISYQALKAATANPAESLRYE